MALKRAKWLKYLFVDRTLAETEQNYWNEKRKKHIANEHKEGVVVGLGVTEANPPSLSIVVQGGRAINTEGNDPEVETAQEIDLTSLVPLSGTTTVYLKLSFNDVEVEPYFVDEIGDYQNKYVQDSSVLEVTTDVPVAPDLELARVELAAGATEITDAVDPLNPAVNEIDLRYQKDSTVFVMGLQDLTDVDPDEADAFNNMNSPSAANPIATMDDVAGGISGVAAEVAEARGSQPSLDDRLDVMLNENGSFKGITGIAPSAPLTGGGSAGSVPIGIDLASPTSDGAMSAADKSNLDANTAHSTGDGSDHSEVAANSGHRGTTTGNPHQISHDDLVGTMPPNAHHSRLHGIDSATDHNGVAGAIENNLIAFDAAGLPKDSNISVLQISSFDVAILRENYGSDTAAGTALKNALENSSYRSIYIGAGTYQFPDSTPVIQATGQTVFCEANGVQIIWSATSTSAAYLQLTLGTQWFGGFFQVISGGNAGVTGTAVGLIRFPWDRISMYGTWVLNAPENAFTSSGTVLRDVNLVGCVAVNPGVLLNYYADGFCWLAGLVNCRAYGGGRYGFRYCDRLSGCDCYGGMTGFGSCYNLVACKAIGGTGTAFSMCQHMSGCLAEGYGYQGISYCFHVSGCKSYGIDGNGFNGCLQVTACESSANAQDGFYACEDMAGCYAWNNDSDGFYQCETLAGCRSHTNDGYGFNDCSWVAASKASFNTTGDWTAMTKKDTDSCN